MISIGKLLCDILWWDKHTNKGLNLTDESSYGKFIFVVLPIATKKRNTK